MISALIDGFIFGLIGWFLWNTFVVTTFVGMVHCTFWQAYWISVGLIFLANLFGRKTTRKKD